MSWRDKTIELAKKHELGFLVNPGGGQFVNPGKGINIQVSAMDDKDDYEHLFKGLQELGLEEKGMKGGLRFFKAGGKPLFCCVPKFVKWGKNVSMFWLGYEFVVAWGEK